MGAPRISQAGRSSHRFRLPAFCRTSRPTTVAVKASSLHGLRLLVLVGLLFQLSTLLLVLAGPVPPRLAPFSTSTAVSLEAGVAGGIQPLPPISDR